MRGRKPKPTAIKKLTGNPGKRPLNDAEPHPPIPGRTPYVPRFLSDDGKKAWRELVKVLVDVGLYTVIDKFALAMFCQAYGRWMHAEQKVDELGEMLISKKSGQPYTNPWAYRADKHWEQARKMLSEFGLSPAERSRIKAAHQDEEMTLAEMLFAEAYESDG